jgi:hypothetical protein
VHELRIRCFGPTPGRLIELIGKNADRRRYLDALLVKEAKFVFPVKTARRDACICQPIQGDVVEDVVPRKALGLARENTGDQRQAGCVVIEDPRGKPDG